MTSSHTSLPLPPKHGSLTLRDHFEQRKIGPTYGSIRSRLPLRTPSGPQFVESALESELVEQLAFADGIHDIMTQLVIRDAEGEKKRHYSIDVAVQLQSSQGGHPLRYLIEVKRARDLAERIDGYRDKFAAVRLFAEEVNATFRIMTEAEIRTEYLVNTRKLARRKGTVIGGESLAIIMGALGQGPLDVVSVIEILVAKGRARLTPWTRWNAPWRTGRLHATCRSASEARRYSRHCRLRQSLTTIRIYSSGLYGSLLINEQNKNK